MRRTSIPLLLALSSSLALPPPAAGQGPEESRVRQVAVMYSNEGGPRALRTWQGHVERAATAAGYAIVDDPVAWANARAAALGDVRRERVEPFREVEGMLVEARRESASLREGAALSLLARAEGIVADHADVPGAAAWLAEVYTAIGITAAQAGSSRLMEDALSKAATLDRTRGVRAAEAPPEVVARAEAIAGAVATRETGSFEVRASAPNARVFLDDEEIGAVPRVVRAPVGRHVLRVTAEGHLPWGRAIEVLEGRRATIDVALSPDPIVREARSLSAAARVIDPEQIASSVSALRGLDAAWVIHVGEAPRYRALFVACTARGCAEPRRLEVDEVPIVIPRGSAGSSHVRDAIVSGRLWVRAPPPRTLPPEELSLWERWWVWAGAAVIVGAAVSAAIVLTRPESEQRRHVVVDPDF